MEVGIPFIYVKFVKRNGSQLGKKWMPGMSDLIQTIDKIRHEHFRPLYQSLRSHMEIAHNTNLHISPAVLKDVIKRLTIIETSILTLIEKES